MVRFQIFNTSWSNSIQSETPPDKETENKISFKSLQTKLGNEQSMLC